MFDPPHPKRPCPLLHELVTKGDWLHMGCHQCDRDKVMTGYEACYRFGHQTTFDELRAIIQWRCGNEKCWSTAGIAAPHQIPQIMKTKVL